MSKILKSTGVIFVCIFVGVGLFAFSKALSLFKNKTSLIWEIDNTYKPKLAELEKIEKEHNKMSKVLERAQDSLAVLEEENKIIKSTLRSKNDNLKQHQTELEEKDKIITQVRSNYNDVLGENNLLKEKMNAMYTEFTEMKKILSSVSELKDRIEYLRRRGDDRASIDDDDSYAGNGGFLVRNGQSTYVPKVKIEVRPVEG